MIDGEDGWSNSQSRSGKGRIDEHITGEATEEGCTVGM